MRVYCHKHYKECVIAPRRYWNKGLMKEMTSFAGWNFMGSAVSMISAYGQGIILNHFFGTILNAAQGIALQINGLLQTLSSNMLKAVNPILGKSAGAQDTQMLIKATTFGAKYASALYSLIAIPIFIEAPYILKLWLQNIPEWTIIFVRFQLLRTFIEFQFTTLPSSIAATGKIKKYSFYSSLSNLLQLPAIYIFFRLGFPPYFMYIATILFGNLIVYAFALHFAKKNYSLSPTLFLREVLTPLYITTMITIVILCVIKQFIDTSHIINLIALIILSVFTYCFVFITLSSKEEKSNLLQLITYLKKRIKK